MGFGVAAGKQVFLNVKNWVEVLLWILDLSTAALKPEGPKVTTNFYIIYPLISTVSFSIEKYKEVSSAYNCILC